MSRSTAVHADSSGPSSTTQNKRFQHLDNGQHAKIYRTARERLLLNGSKCDVAQRNVIRNHVRGILRRVTLTLAMLRR